jgi:hypothetical protein
LAFDIGKDPVHVVGPDVRGMITLHQIVVARRARVSKMNNQAIAGFFRALTEVN